MPKVDVDRKIEQCLTGWRKIVRRELARGSRWFFFDIALLPEVLPAGSEAECRRRCPSEIMLSLTDPMHLELAEEFIRKAVEALASLALAREASAFPGVGGKG